MTLAIAVMTFSGVGQSRRNASHTHTKEGRGIVCVFVVHFAHWGVGLVT